MFSSKTNVQRLVVSLLILFLKFLRFSVRLLGEFKFEAFLLYNSTGGLAGFEYLSFLKLEIGELLLLLLTSN